MTESQKKILAQGEIETITLLKCGTNVITKVGRIAGIISQISIRYDIIRYEIMFYSDNDFKYVWMGYQEFIVSDEPIKKLGYKQ